MPLGVGAVDVTPVQGDQPAGGVEHVGRGGVAALGVAHLVGQHRRQPDLGGHPGQVGGAGRGAGQPVVDQLDLQAAGRHQRAPAGQLGTDQVVAVPLQRRPEERAGAEQDDHVAGAQQRGDLGALRVEHGRAALAGEVGRREDPAHRGPAATAAPGTGRVREEGHARQPRVAEGTAAHRRTTAAAGLPWLADARSSRAVGEVDAEDRGDVSDLAGLGELHRAVGAVAVGERQQVHAVLDGPLHQARGQRGAVAQGVAGGHVQVGERVAHGSLLRLVSARPRTAPRPLLARLPRTRRRRTRVRRRRQRNPARARPVKSLTDCRRSGVPSSLFEHPFDQRGVEGARDERPGGGR